MASLRTLRGLRRGPAPVLASRHIPSHSHAHLSRREFSSLLEIASVPVDALSSLIVSSPLSYGATIIGLTVAVRSAISLPASLWVRQRTKKLRETVMPLIKAENDRLAVQVFMDCKARGVGRDVYMKELKKKVADAQYALHKKHGTHPVLTMAVPFITNIPILLITSLAIRNAIQMPDTALVGQSLLWIKDITEPDPHGAMGMIAGCMAFASSEIHNVRRRRFEKIAAEEAAPSVPAEVDALETPATAASTPTPTPSPAPAPARTTAKPKLPHRPFSTSATARAAPPTRKRKPASAPVSAVPRQGQQSARRMPGVVQVVDGKRTIVPLSKLLQEENAIGGGADAAKEAAGAFQRGLERVGKIWSIGIIGLSLVQPAALVAYWVTSIGYTMIQNAVFGYIDEKEDRALRARRRLAAQLAQGQGQQVPGQAVRTAAAAAAANPPPPTI